MTERFSNSLPTPANDNDPQPEWEDWDTHLQRSNETNVIDFELKRKLKNIQQTLDALDAAQERIRALAVDHELDMEDIKLLNESKQELEDLGELGVELQHVKNPNTPQHMQAAAHFFKVADEFLARVPNEKNIRGPKRPRSA